MAGLAATPRLFVRHGFIEHVDSGTESPEGSEKSFRRVISDPCLWDDYSARSYSSPQESLNTPPEHSLAVSDGASSNERQSEDGPSSNQRQWEEPTGFRPVHPGHCTTDTSDYSLPVGSQGVRNLPSVQTSVDKLASDNMRLSEENRLLWERMQLLQEHNQLLSDNGWQSTVPNTAQSSIPPDNQLPQGFSMVEPGFAVPVMVLSGQVPSPHAMWPGSPPWSPGCAQQEKKHREVPGCVKRTTAMLRNLPNNYTRAMVLAMLDDEGFAGLYDFVYLPIDFKSHAALGYAFVNLVSEAVAASFWQCFDGYTSWVLPTKKVCKVSWSMPHQGVKAHVQRYRNSPLMHESVPDEYKPVVFRSGQRVPFPRPTQELSCYLGAPKCDGARLTRNTGSPVGVVPWFHGVP